MKFNLHYILAGLTIFLLTSPTFSQTKWGLPISININIPIRMSYGSADNIPPSGHSSSSIANDSLSLNATYIISGKLKSFTFDNDTINAEFYDPSTPWLTNENFIHCVIDTFQKKIKDFSWTFVYDYEATEGYDKINENISFRPLSYTMQADSSLEVKDSGAICLNNLLSVSYTSTDYRMLDPQHGTYSTSGQTLDSLLEDTALFRCFMTISPTPTKSNVITAQLTNLNSFFVITNSLTNHSVNFSFPSSDHSETLAIYDILGREVKRIEIPSGASEYNISPEQFASGYYFARLGSMGAKFMVY